MARHNAGLAQPGKIERGLRAEACKKHLHQLHVCLPAGTGRTRLLYRMSMDFLEWTTAVPFIDRFWASIANQVPTQTRCPTGCLPTQTCVAGTALVRAAALDAHE